MKCIIHLKTELLAWTKKYFKNESPWLIKIVNKPYLEYIIDFCQMNSIYDILFLETDPDRKLSEYFADGSKWGLNITYSTIKDNEQLGTIIKKNAAYIDNSPLLSINADVFINYDRNTPLEKSVWDSSWEFSDRSILYLNNINESKNIEELNTTCISTSRFNSISDYFKLSNHINIENKDKYVIPGYSSEPLVNIGFNVEIPKTAKITPPVAIGNNVKLKNLTSIGPNAVIGDNTIIDSNTVIHDSIIYDNTYVGSDLLITDKILYQDLLISPANDTMINIVDKFISTATQNRNIHNYISRITSLLAAALFFIIGLIPYLIYKIFFKIKTEEKEIFKDNALNKEKIITPRYSADTFAGRLLYRLMLDKYSCLSNVFSNKLSFIGNTPFEVNKMNENSLSSYEKYSPGLITFIETLEINKEELEIVRDIHELYYNHNKSFALKVKIAIRFILKRLFS